MENSNKKNYNVNKKEARVISLIQAKAYILNGIQPIRVEVDEKANRALIFIFDFEETRELYKLWKERKLLVQE